MPVLILGFDYDIRLLPAPSGYGGQVPPSVPYGGQVPPSVPYGGRRFIS